MATREEKLNKVDRLNLGTDKIVNDLQGRRIAEDRDVSKSLSAVAKQPSAL